MDRMSDPGGHEVRRTSRPNAGIPEARYGNPVQVGTQRKKKTNTKEVAPNEDAASSHSTGRTSACTLRKKEKEAQSNNEIDMLEVDHDLRMKNIELMEIDIKCQRSLIEDKETMFAALLSEEDKQKVTEEIVKHKADLQQMIIDLERAVVVAKFEDKEMDRKKRRIRENTEVEILRIDDEEAINHPDVFPLDKANDKANDKDNDISKWAAASAEFNKSRESNESEEDENEPTSDQLRERFRKLKEVPQIPAQEQFTLQEMAAVLTQAFKGITKSPHKTSDRMLARQLQGRDLPIFTGRPEEWPAFIAAFHTSTTNCQFNNAENLTRLQRCLKGEALRSVQALLIEPDGVPHAISKLEMRFGRPVVIIESLIQKVREVPPVKVDRTETFIDFGIAVDNLVAMIKALKKPEHLANPSLIQELTRKLPLMTQMDWIQKQPSDSPTLEEFSNWVSKYTDAACKLCPPKQTEPHKEEKRRGHKFQDRVYTAADGGASSGFHKPRKEKNERKCPVCNKSGHQAKECHNFANTNVEGRWKIVKEKRMCFGCLILGHRFGDCRSKKICATNGCRLQHHKLLHEDRSKPETTTRVQDEKDEEETNDEVTNFTTEKVYATSASQINHMMIPCLLHGENGMKEKGYAVLDNYSSITAIEDEHAKQLQLNGKPHPLRVKGFNTTSSYPGSRAVTLTITSTDEDYQVTLNNVRTVNKLDLSRQSVHRHTLKKWNHLQGIPIQCYDNARPTILIGLDNPELHLQLDHRKSSNPNAPIAIKTPLGWMLMGRMGPYERADYAYFMSEEDQSLHDMVKEYFTIESIGIKPTMGKPRSREDVRAQGILDSTLKRVPQGWEVGLLWRKDNFQLPNSKQQAFSRLRQMERRMDRDPDFAKQYVQRIQEYEEKGFARKLTPEEAAKESPKTFYLPHFMAFNPKKPTKLRFVFDAAAKVQGNSLNDFLLQGPDKMNSLPGILLKFRQRLIGVTADIQDMFHRVRVRKEDVESQRFLWRGMERKNYPDVWEMSVLIFGAACSPCCAQEAKDRNADEHREEYPEAHNAIVNNHYVDDLLDSCNLVEEAIRLQRDTCHVHSRGGFNLCNWLSNSSEVMEAIPEQLRAKTMKNLDMGTDVPPERVLGLFWKPREDEFTFSLTYLKAQTEILKGEKIPTKREVLSLVMSIYDPLGFLAILTMKAKLIMQRAWTSKVKWDEEIPPSSLGLWRNWLSELENISTFRLPRCYSSYFSTADEIQLHIFCDASSEAYGAVGYFRIRRNSITETIFVIAKSKVSPLKELSIPRLELQAALIGARLSKFIKEELPNLVYQTILWTDSSTVLKWIRAEGKRYQQFVSHRVGEIQDITNVQEWRWIPTNENVADELTRSAKPCNWDPDSRWLNGPSFLLGPMESWPTEKGNTYEPSEVELEERKQAMKIREVIFPIEIERFSKWWRLIRTTAFVLRFINKLRKKSIMKGTGLSVSETAEAEKLWWRHVQEDIFHEEIEAVISKEPLPKKSKLANVSLMVDVEGILRVRGRLDHAKIPIPVKYPVILEAKHPFTKMLILHYHTICGHHGHERIGNEVRQMFYIPSLRTAVKRAQNYCQVCKNTRANPRIPEMGQLPKFRLESNTFPFNKTGLDYFGPVEVVVKRSREKRWVALFTCLSTRAIHLEVANALSTDSCLLAIRRFISRRLCPQEIHSDNGTNFVGANSELKKSLDDLNQGQISEECSSRGIRWSYIPPSSPHFGGSWERMVRSVKVALGAVLKTKNLSDEVLYTVIVEAEHTVNCHPLTHVPDDPNDMEALTPNHFLIGRSSNIQPWGEFTRDDLFGRKQWRIAQQMADHFWRRWVKEFLPTLLRREKWCSPSHPIQVNDVVLEVNENLPRNNWPKGRVVKTFPGEDGLIRVVEIKLANGRTYRRPVAKLCILDLGPEPAITKTPVITD